MAEELVMPRLSDTMEEGTIGRWLVHEGDSFSEGDVLAEIETDKATMEFQAYDGGTVLRILVSDGESAPLGAPIAIVGDAGEQVADGEAPAQEPAPAEEEASAATAEEQALRRSAGSSRPLPPPSRMVRAEPQQLRRCGFHRSRGGWPTRPASTCARWPAAAAGPRAGSSRQTWNGCSTAARARHRRQLALLRLHRRPRRAPRCES